MPKLARRTPRPMIVGEQNPYGSDPYFALYPAPDGCSGHRLCCTILGMRRSQYLDQFDRVNLCEGPWSKSRARARAAELIQQSRRVILCGAKVCAAWQTVFTPFEISEGGTVLVLPHPSGANRMWNDPQSIERARSVIRLFAPDIAHMIGVQ